MPKLKANPVAMAQGRRLAEARRLAGFRSARAAALEYEWPESSYRAHEGGTRTIGQDDAERYMKRYRARGVDLDAKYILFGGARASTSEVPKLDAAILEAAIEAVIAESVKLQAAVEVRRAARQLAGSVLRIARQGQEQLESHNDSSRAAGIVRSGIRAAFRQLAAEDRPGSGSRRAASG